MKIGNREFDETKIENAATRAAITTIAEALVESGAATTQQLTAIGAKLEGFDPAQITELKTLVESLKTTPPKPGDPKPADDKNKGGNGGGGGDATEALLAKVAELLKPVTDDLNAIKGERTAQQRSAANSETIDAYLKAKHPNRNPANLALVRKRLVAEFAQAEKIEPAALEKSAGGYIDEYASAAGAKNAETWLGASPTTKGGADGGNATEAEEQKAAALAKVRAGRALFSGASTSEKGNT